MRASAIEFRLRALILAAIIVVGFFAPWIELWGIRHRISLLEWLTLEISRLGLFSFAAATPVVILFASALAALGAIFRVWGTAYLNPAIVNNPEMKAGAVMASGPYRYVRNPLYLGAFFMIAAIAFAMPASGALFALPLVAFFLLRLILGEEAFLTIQLGEPYQAYLRAVPRLVPRLRSPLPQSGSRPQWASALLAEINPIGILLITAILSWRYDNALTTRAIVISFGLSLVARATVSRDSAAAPGTDPQKQ